MDHSSESLKLIRGHFTTRGVRVTGSSIGFRADNPALLADLGFRPGPGRVASVRLIGIDAWDPDGDDRKAATTWGREARTALERLLRVGADRDECPGFLLASRANELGHVLAYAFTGTEAPRPTADHASSLNHALLAAGKVYVCLTSTMPGEVRQAFLATAIEARVRTDGWVLDPPIEPSGDGSQGVRGTKPPLPQPRHERIMPLLRRHLLAYHRARDAAGDSLMPFAAWLSQTGPMVTPPGIDKPVRLGTLVSTEPTGEAGSFEIQLEDVDPFELVFQVKSGA